MKCVLASGLLALATLTSPVRGQEPVVPAQNVDQLFISPDPQLNANKQVVYRILRELLEAGHWDKADELLSEEYIQHKPNMQSGRAAIVDFVTRELKVEPRPLAESLNMKVVAVIAEADLVTVLFRRTVSDPGAPGGSYTTTWHDTWRIEDGKATEHWDPALRGESPDLF